MNHPRLRDSGVLYFCSQQISASRLFANCSFAPACPARCTVSRNVVCFALGESYADALMQLDHVAVEERTRWQE